MTVSSSTARADYLGNGVSLAFSIPFRFLVNTDLLVLRTVTSTGNSTTLTLDSLGADGYSVTGAGQPSGGTITVITAPSALETLTILRSVSRTQLTDYIPNDPFPAESHERALDKLTMIVQEQDETITRALVLPPGLPGTSSTLPLPDPLKGLRWNAGASGLENFEITPFAAPGGSDNVGFLQAGVGANARTVQDKLRERASVLDFIPAALHAGLAAGTELSPQQAGFNAALTAANEVVVPAGTYYLSDMVTIPVGKRLVGAGRRKTLIRVPATFNLAAAGVFRLEAGEPGGEISDMTIEFEQPDAVLIGSYTQYPPAINAQAAPRCKISRMRIALAWDGIDLTGNSGGSSIDDLELSMFNIGIEIHGSLDTMRINSLHLWPFGAGNTILTANQRGINAAAYGIHSGQCDGLCLSNSLIFDVRKGVYCYKGATAVEYTIGSFSNVGFDGDGGLHIVDDARIFASSCYFTKDSVDGNAINQAGGTLHVANSRFLLQNALLTSNGGIEVSAGACELVGNRYERGSQDNRVIYATGTASVSVTGGFLSVNPNISFTKPVFHYAGSNTGVIAGLYAQPKGTGTGALVAIVGDSGVSVIANVADGWNVSGPSTRAKTVVTNNIGPEADQFAGCVDSAGVSAGLPTGWTSGTLGTGNYTVTHNLGLNAVRDVVVIPACESGDSVAVWDVAGSTVNQIRVRTFTAGVAANAAFSFTVRRRR